MIALFLTYCYAKYQNEPCILMGMRELDGGYVEVIICLLTDGAMKIVPMDQVKINPDKLKDIRNL